MKNYRKTKFYKSLDSYLATAYAEGFCEGENATEEEQLTAWQYISDNGLHSQLQGWFGRMVYNLLEEGLISPKEENHIS